MGNSVKFVIVHNTCDRVRKVINIQKRKHPAVKFAAESRESELSSLSYDYKDNRKIYCNQEIKNLIHA